MGGGGEGGGSTGVRSFVNCDEGFVEASMIRDDKGGQDREEEGSPTAANVHWHSNEDILTPQNVITITNVPVQVAGRVLVVCMLCTV